MKAKSTILVEIPQPDQVQYMTLERIRWYAKEIIGTIEREAIEKDEFTQRLRQLILVCLRMDEDDLKLYFECLIRALIQTAPETGSLVIWREEVGHA